MSGADSTREEQQNEGANHDNGFWLTTTRLESLTDNIFAFAMTILVVNLVLPPVPDKFSFDSVRKVISDIFPHVASFVISFLILAVFWIKHHKLFHVIERVDRILLWLNIFIGLGVVFLPFTTQLSAIHNGKQIAELALDLNLLFIGILFYMTWVYATWNHRLVNPAWMRRE
jgi:uncharacterized membrane protein